jgi:hypothetical protein
VVFHPETPSEMKEAYMFKKFFLSIAGSATSCGCFVPLVLGVITTMLLCGLRLISDRFAGMLFLLTFIVSILATVIFTVIRKKYIAHVDDYDESRELETRKLIKLNSNGVVEAGDKFWGKDGVFVVYIPYCFGGYFDTETTIGYVLDSVHVRVQVHLTVWVENHNQDMRGFDPQELYDKLIQDGQHHLMTWIAMEFKRTAENSPAVREAFEKNAKKQPFYLIQALNTALKKIDFHRPLANITSVETKIASSVDVSSTVTLE